MSMAPDAVEPESTTNNPQGSVGDILEHVTWQTESEKPQNEPQSDREPIDDAPPPHLRQDRQTTKEPIGEAAGQGALPGIDAWRGHLYRAVNSVDRDNHENHTLSDTEDCAGTAAGNLQPRPASPPRTLSPPRSYIPYVVVGNGQRGDLGMTKMIRRVAAFVHRRGSLLAREVKAAGIQASGHLAISESHLRRCLRERFLHFRAFAVGGLRDCLDPLPSEADLRQLSAAVVKAAHCDNGMEFLFVRITEEHSRPVEVFSPVPPVRVDQVPTPRSGSPDELLLPVRVFSRGLGLEGYAFLSTNIQLVRDVLESRSRLFDALMMKRNPFTDEIRFLRIQTAAGGPASQARQKRLRDRLEKGAQIKEAILIEKRDTLLLDIQLMD